MEKKSSYIGARSNLALYYVTLKNQATWQKDKLQHKKAIKPPHGSGRQGGTQLPCTPHNFSRPCHQMENKSVCSKHPPTLGSQQLFTSWLL